MGEEEEEEEAAAVVEEEQQEAQEEQEAVVDQRRAGPWLSAVTHRAVFGAADADACSTERSELRSTAGGVYTVGLAHARGALA